MAKKTKIYFLIFLIAALLGGFFFVAKSQTINLLGQSATQNQNVDFFVDWSVDTYVPPEYDGKPLPTYGSKITLSATPLSTTNINDYMFNWLIDLAFVPINNGQSRTYFTAQKTTGGEHFVQLEIIEKKSKKVVIEKTTTIVIIAPQNIIYQETSWGHLIPLNRNINIAPGGQLTLSVKPLFFNQILSNKLLNYRWLLNNQQLTGAIENPDKLSIEFPDEVRVGTQYNLKSIIENPFNVFQSAENNYKIVIK